MRREGVIVGGATRETVGAMHDGGGKGIGAIQRHQQWVVQDPKDAQHPVLSKVRKDPQKQGVIALFPAQRWHEEALADSSSAAVDGLSTWSTGAVASVVASAINTIMAKSVGEITLRSSPMFRIINSMRPRVFMSVPRTAA